MSIAVRLLPLGPPAAGAFNMAVDEALLDSAERFGIATWRWYRWAEPTLSLGYFQSAADRLPRFAGTPVVRRTTGGGAILHDDELTYSFAFPRKLRIAAVPQKLVADVHSAFIAALSRVLPVLQTAALHSGAEGKELPGGEPFLCFARRSPGDLVAGAEKALGSAQRSQRGAVLQHGSLPLRRSSAAPEIAGLADLAAGFRPDPARLCAAVEDDLSRRWNAVFTAGELSTAELALAALLTVDRHANPEWIERR